MPTYDYVCDACDHEFEQFQSITADPLKKCPKCGKRKLRRLIGTGAAIMFKGSGFYQTDYRSDSYKKHAEADKPASTTGDTKSQSKTVGKTDSGASGVKTESKPAAETSGGKSEGKKSPAKKKP
ncbi:MAG TPA: zinc ribbon domain-containing protein [Pirellulales bacterium]|nr:zinc ribbon domain-containing protein [Pirellulales bacterium]